MIVVLALVDGVALGVYAARGRASAGGDRMPGVRDRADAVFGVLEREGLRASLGALERAAAKDSAVLRDGHQLAHALGRRAFERAGESRSVVGDCTPIFASGCYHGVVEASLAEARKIDMAELERMCLAAGSEEHRAAAYECVHGLGHGVLGVVSHDVPGALHHCDALAEPQFAAACREGVFMEAINSALGERLHHAGHTANERTSSRETRLELDPEDPFAPCDRFTGLYAGSCWLFQGFVILSHHHFDAAAALRSCEGAPGGMVQRCSQSVGFQLTGVFQRDDRWIIAQCGKARPELAPSCAAGAAAALGAMDWSGARAAAFCGAAPAEWKLLCYREVGISLALRTSPDRWAEICGRLEPQYAEACRLDGRV